MKQLKAAIFGASGYSGGELLRLLERHPSVKITQAFANTSAGALVSSVHAGRADGDAMEFESFDGVGSLDAEICFLALPHGEAIELTPALLEAGKIVIDLSGDHRLMDSSAYEQYYRRAAAPPSVMAKAVYGLPEWNAEAIRSARLVANPGCYATSAILALAPLLANGLIEPDSIVINGMSGVSGAGRKAAIEYSFVEVNENIRAYRAGDHQHTPEIEQALTQIGGQPVQVTFIPHLIPITRGIYSTIVARQRGSGMQALQALKAAFEGYYADKPFVRFHAKRIPEVRHVTNTNYVDIGLRYVPERNQVIIMSTLDNLVKGAAGQAVQNMNLACGFQETEGLL
ncbi:MAG: N-acetyl-gamma-glutamyl-phosphate reductase [Bacteroidota bacterium]|nr:N-acetyl-gamma-glutamyl-phosphate reductase [Bacteroidota bacterium]MDP4231750.1 N-acetyl-gamma-glutamyl-phosphate reductase [Bacteroidota bacterium]MDP4243486.1 N-acetyl-gamma-glutamyl-phosphate reductase [Bacteroidota bacterium]MDP4289258.1 N-acetyl-gamma-glutamyl-phosphate reductase [Bacteroidota bacterium]